jgi:hypothetical protein
MCVSNNINEAGGEPVLLTINQLARLVTYLLFDSVYSEFSVLRDCRVLVCCLFHESVTPSEEHGLVVFEGTVMRRVCRPAEEEVTGKKLSGAHQGLQHEVYVEVEV